MSLGPGILETCPFCLTPLLYEEIAYAPWGYIHVRLSCHNVDCTLRAAVVFDHIILNRRFEGYEL